jgi:hypothetical protein
MENEKMENGKMNKCPISIRDEHGLRDVVADEVRVRLLRHRKHVWSTV